jgi:hypothetical protein
MNDLADGIISNCYSTGSVQGDRSLIGGLLGYNGALVEDCYTTCTIILTSTGGNLVQNGGFVGLNAGLIRRCYATGNINCIGAVASDIEEIGGFVGLQTQLAPRDIYQCFATGSIIVNNGALALDDVNGIGGFVGGNDANIYDCFARGDVTVKAGVGGADYVGGFAGYNTEPIDRCYSTGLVTTVGMGNVGGFCGENFDVITDSFWDTETSGQAASDGGTGKTTEQMKDVITFENAGWSMSRIWNVLSFCSSGYPCLIGVNPCCSVQSSVADYTLSEPKVTLERIRNLELVYGGRFYVDKSGNAVYESRFHRNV